MTDALKTIREALEWYADAEHYDSHEIPLSDTENGPDYFTPVLEDEGAQAREALALLDSLSKTDEFDRQDGLSVKNDGLEQPAPADEARKAALDMEEMLSALDAFHEWHDGKGLWETYWRMSGKYRNNPGPVDDGNPPALQHQPEAVGDDRKCHRTRCQKEGATWWNPSTRNWYCRECAAAINEGTYPQLCIPETSLPALAAKGEKTGVE